MSSTNVIFEKPSEVLTALHSPGGKRLLAWVAEWRSSIEHKIRTADATGVYRYQGNLEVLDRLFGLSSEITTYQTKKQKGEV